MHYSRFRDPFLGMSIALACLLMSALSIARYSGYNAGMLDLGNMAQAIWSATQGQPLVFTQPTGAYSRLAGHFEVFYFLLAPLYALWADPRVLLLVQAVLYAAGAIAVARLAQRRLDNRFAVRALVLLYLAYPVAQTAVLFDFHGDTLAMPLLLVALDALDQRAWRRYALFVLLALTCKVYVALAVVGMGVVVALWGPSRRAGVITALAALAYGGLVFVFVRPLFAHPEANGTAQATGNYLSFYFGDLQLLLASVGERFLTAVIVFGPALLVAWRGWRWLLPGLPIALGALVSTGPGGTFDYRYHHYALVVPFIVMATIEGATQGRLQAQRDPATQRRRTWRGTLGLTTAIVVICNIAFVDTPLNPLFWMGIPGQGRDASMYGVTPRDAIKDRFLRENVPPHVPLAASMFLAAHLTNRPALYLTRYADDPGGQRMPSLLPKVDYVVTDALFDFYVPLPAGYGGGVDYEREAIAAVLHDPDFGFVAQRDGLLLFKRGAPLSETLAYTVEQLAPDPAHPALARFGDALELVDRSIAQLAGGRVRASFTWRALRSLNTPSPVAVSWLEGVTDARIVHLPTFALLPPTTWAVGALVRETFEVTLPADLPPVTYTWRTAWYRAGSPYAAETDARAMLAGSAAVVMGTVRR